MTNRAVRQIPGSSFMLVIRWIRHRSFSEMRQTRTIDKVFCLVHLLGIIAKEVYVEEHILVLTFKKVRGAMHEELRYPMGQDP